MAGTVVIIVVLLLAPVAVLMGSLLLTAALGWVLNAAVDAEHEGSELLALAYPDEG